MPRFNFYFSPTHHVTQPFDRHPNDGELIALGETYGVCLVAGKTLPQTDSAVDAEYDIVPVRAMTADELAAFNKDPYTLPPPGSQRYRYAP